MQRSACSPGSSLRPGAALGFVGLLAAWLSAAPAGAAEVALDVTPLLSHDGVYALSWTAPGEVVLEESRDPSFAEVREVYRGADKGTVLTGRSDGVYHYRVRPIGASGGRDARVTVEVAHHPVGRALGFFAVGLFVFVSTIVLVARGPEGGEEAEAPTDE